jgi:hypothetical protein
MDRAIKPEGTTPFMLVLEFGETVFALVLALLLEGHFAEEVRVGVIQVP